MMRFFTRYDAGKYNFAIVCSLLVILLTLLGVLASTFSSSYATPGANSLNSLRLPGRTSKPAFFMEDVQGHVFVPSIVPVDMSEGRVSSEFGMRIHPVSKVRRMHAGIDLAVSTGTKIMATAEGYVSFADVRGGYGNLVIIDHLNDMTTRYAHLSKIYVREGDYVRRGDIIGLVGATGVVTGPHLHYEVRIAGEEQNPRDFLPEGFDRLARQKQTDSADLGGE